MINYASFSFFIIYFGSTFLLHALLPGRVKWLALLAGSYVFYFISARGNVMALLACSLIVWSSGCIIQSLNDKAGRRMKGLTATEKKTIRKRYGALKKLVLVPSVLAVISILFFFKYSAFFADTANGLFQLSITVPKIIQPLGISFFTLEGISYLEDVYQKKIKAEINPLKVSLYLSFMLTIVEGPISRYDQLGEQIVPGRNADISELSKGFMRVLWGLFKKVVIADRAAMLVNAVFDNNMAYDGLVVVAGIAFYTLQLYCEFSGIMDVMCGLGSMLGIRMAENFRRPFFAKSINEFWQRWHISLGTWLRDYVFYNISFSTLVKKISGSMKKHLDPYYASLIPTAIALFFVWFTNGFWHGSGWKYIAYGLYYYILMMLGLVLEPVFARLCRFLMIDRSTKAFDVFRVIRTVLIVNIGMLIFRADSLKTAVMMFRSIFVRPDFTTVLPGAGNGFNLNIYDYIVLAAGTAAVFGVSLIEEKGVDLKEKIYRLSYPVKVMIYLAMLMSIIIFGAYGKEYGAVDLIYANF